MSVPGDVKIEAPRVPSPMVWFSLLTLATVGADFVLGIARQNAFVDAVIFSLAAYWSTQLIRKTGLPLWYRRPAGRLARASVWAAGLLAIVLNFYFTGWRTVSFHVKLPDYILNVASTPLKGTVMSLRAGITEEILFRLLLGSLVMLAVGKLTARAPRWTKPLSVVVTGFGFYLLLHRNILGFVCGTALSYVYFEAGLVPAMVVHFVADLIPWGLMIPLMRR